MVVVLRILKRTSACRPGLAGAVALGLLFAFGPIVSANMLCLPADVPANVRGLQPVEGPHDTWKRAVSRR